MTTCYSAEQISEVIGVAPSTIHSYRKMGLIPFYQFGRSIRFPEEGINRWMELYYVPALGEERVSV